MGYAALGAAGGVGYVTTNYVNSIAQKSISNTSNSNKGNGDRPYSAASSIIEEGDSVQDIYFFLYSNLLLSIFILSLLILLLYLYSKYKKYELPLLVVWILLVFSSLFSV